MLRTYCGGIWIVPRSIKFHLLLKLLLLQLLILKFTWKSQLLILFSLPFLELPTREFSFHSASGENILDPLLFGVVIDRHFLRVATYPMPILVDLNYWTVINVDCCSVGHNPQSPLLICIDCYVNDLFNKGNSLSGTWAEGRFQVCLLSLESTLSIIAMAWRVFSVPGWRNTTGCNWAARTVKISLAFYLKSLWNFLLHS